MSPEYGGALRRGCGIYPRRGPTLPDSLNTVPLSLQREDDRESVDFHVYADMYFKTSISTAPRPRLRERCVWRYFRFTIEMPSPVDTALEGRNESLRTIDNPP